MFWLSLVSEYRSSPLPETPLASLPATASATLGSLFVSRDTPPTPPTPPSQANPSAAHAVRSGMDEPFVTNVGGARARLVLGRFRWQT